MLALLGGAGRSVSAGLTASSKTWNASSSLRCLVVGTCRALVADQTDLCGPQIASIAFCHDKIEVDYVNYFIFNFFLIMPSRRARFRFSDSLIC